MAIEIHVPQLGESISEATVARWMKAPGDAVEADEPLVELETDKVTVEVPAPRTGVLEEILAGEGEEVEVGAVLGRMAAGVAPARAVPTPKAKELAPVSADAPALSPAARKLLADNATLTDYRLQGNNDLNWARTTRTLTLTGTAGAVELVLLFKFGQGSLWSNGNSFPASPKAGDQHLFPAAVASGLTW